MVWTDCPTILPNFAYFLCRPILYKLESNECEKKNLDLVLSLDTRCLHVSSHKYPD